MSGNEYQGYEVQKHRAFLLGRMYLQVGGICLVLQLLLLLALLQYRVDFSFQMVPAPHRELAWKWPLARFQTYLSYEGTFLLHSEQVPHWWSGTQTKVIEVRAGDLVRFPYRRVFSSPEAHWCCAVVLSCLGWPFWFVARFARRRIMERLHNWCPSKSAIFCSSPWVWLENRLQSIFLRLRDFSWVNSLQKIGRQQLEDLDINRLVARASSLSVTIGLWVSSWRGTLLGCLLMQSVFLSLLLNFRVELVFQMVPAPHRELALKWPLARLQQAVGLNGEFLLHSEDEVHWWDGRRARIAVVKARELVYLPYSRVFSSKEAHWGKAAVLSFLAWLMFPTVLWKYRRETRRMESDEHVRGAQLCTENEIAGAGNGILYIGGIRISEDLSRRHILIAGQTGSGKSTLIIQHLAAIQRAKRRALVNDFKGELVEHFYRPDTDLILNPLDKRGIGWTLFNEVSSSLDLAAIASSLIPLAKGDDRFWSAAAQDVLRGVMAHCYQFGKRSNAALWQALTAPIKEIAAMCKATETGRAGYSYIQDASSKQAASVIAVLISYVSWLEFATDGTFSLREWAATPKDQTIFITSLEAVSNIMRPYLSLFADLAGKRLLALPENDNPQNSIYLLFDELGNMQRLPSVKRLLTAGRSKGMVVEIGIQEFAGVASVYGRDDTRTIINNCGSKMVLNLGDPEAAELFSDLGGQEEYWHSSTTFSISPNDERDGESHNRQLRVRKVIMPAEIMRLPVGKGYFMLPGGNAALVELPWTEANRRPAVNEAFQLRDGLSLEDLQVRDQDVALSMQEGLQNPAPENLKEQLANNALYRSRGMAKAAAVLQMGEDRGVEMSSEGQE
jgi:type IV secretory pathway TraG/TraD family ATPase VirD4